MATKKFELHWDAAIVIALVFVASFGFNLFQRHQFQGLLQETIDAKWEADNMKVNWLYVKKKLEDCQKAPVTNADIPG